MFKTNCVKHLLLNYLVNLKWWYSLQSIGLWFQWLLLRWHCLIISLAIIFNLSRKNLFDIVITLMLEYTEQYYIINLIGYIFLFKEEYYFKYFCLLINGYICTLYSSILICICTKSFDRLVHTLMLSFLGVASLNIHISGGGKSIKQVSHHFNTS